MLKSIRNWLEIGFVRRVDVQTETIERYIREGKLYQDEWLYATMRFDCPHIREESNRILDDYLSEANHTFTLHTPPNGKTMWIYGEGTASLPRNDGRSGYLSAGA